MKIKYNWECDRYVTDDGKVLRYDSKQDKLVLCKLSAHNAGYPQVLVRKPKRTIALVHRLVFETFIGEIPKGYEIDHINTVRDDNRLENLRVVTHRENQNNQLTKEHLSKPKSVFGNKFKEHYGITRIDDVKLYDRELHWYLYHNKTCRWEMNTDERN